MKKIIILLIFLLMISNVFALTSDERIQIEQVFKEQLQESEQRQNDLTKKEVENSINQMRDEITKATNYIADTTQSTINNSIMVFLIGFFGVQLFTFGLFGFWRTKVESKQLILLVEENRELKSRLVGIEKILGVKNE